jgi:hypothetical protein
MAINKIRDYAEKNLIPKHELLPKILSNLVGFDLNPLAVMAARTNYLLALRELLKLGGEIEIPVYLCDSIMTPAEYGELITKQGVVTGGVGKVQELKTSAARFMIPTEIARSRQTVAAYTEELERCARHGYTEKEFISRLKGEGIPADEEELHRSLYRQVISLKKQQKNDIWARIIKNSFAPLFIEQVDYVIGNPPWVFWNNLPPEYRDQVRHLMIETYQIAARSASTMKRLGSAGKDISSLFVYVCLDKYLANHGTLGFVVTQTLFQSTASDEFRRFRLPGTVPFCISHVDDWIRVSPFVAAANKTATFVAIKGDETKYPVPYQIWEAIDTFNRETASLDEVKKKTICGQAWASPSDARRPTSFWTIGQARTVRKPVIIQEHRYPVRRGVETGLESAFRVRILKWDSGDTVLVENITERAKKPLPQIQRRVEISRIFPYITGASIKRWHAWSPGNYIVPHTKDTGMQPIPEAKMRVLFPDTYAFLASFRNELLKRGIHSRWGKGNPFYSLYDIGPYTFSDWKLVWKRSTRNFEAAVVSVLPLVDKKRALVIPNGKVMMVPFDEPNPAHFLCAMLNSSIARSQINAAISSEAHAEMLELLSLPPYARDNPIHVRLAELSRLSHLAALKEDMKTVVLSEDEIDELAANLWSISRRELAQIQAVLKNK